MTRAPRTLATARRLAFAGAAIVALSGCTFLNDPYRREGTWRPEYSNDLNLRAMASVPSDLVRGDNDHRGSNGQLMDAALERQRTDKVRSLPTTAIAGALPTGAAGGN